MRVLDSWQQDISITSVPGFITPPDVLIWTRPLVVLSGQCVEILTYPHQMYAHLPYKYFYHSHLLHI